MARIKALPTEHSSRYYPDDYFAPLNWEQVFENTAPVEIELGAGDGSFLLHYATQHPKLNLLGIERLLGRIRKIDRNAYKAKISNLRLLRIEAGYFLKYLPINHSVQGIHVYFPDPWPKKRHHKNRLINSMFVEQCKRVLTPAGHVYLRTDHVEYFEQMVSVFGASPDFELLDTPEQLKCIKTDFEAEFNQQGIRTQYATFRFVAETSPDC